MEEKKLEFNNAVVTVQITQPINYEKLKNETVKFMLEMVKESEAKYES